MAEPLRVIVRPSDAWTIVKEAPDPGVGALDVANQPGSPWTVQKEEPAPAPVQATPPTPGPWTVQKEEPAPEGRGIGARTLGGIKHGFGESPLGIDPETRAQYPGWQAVQPLVAPIDAAMRTIPAAVGGLAGLGAGAFEALGGSQASADRFQRDVGQMGHMALVAAGLRYGKAPRLAKEVFAPEVVSPEAETASGLIRSKTGPAARQKDITVAELRPYEAMVNKLPVPEQMNVIHYVEGGGVVPATPALRSLADTLKATFREARTKLEQLPQHLQTEFVQEYFPHFWEVPGGAATPSRGAGKQGSATSLQHRTLPTYEEGIRQGYVPKFTNPIDATLHYSNSINNYIAAMQVLNEGEASGMIQWVRPKVTGASGHPQGFQPPAGMEPLIGRGAERGGAQAYAPADFARVYNNWLSKGFQGEAGTLYEGARKVSNFMTQAKLSLSGYHPFTMMEATLSNQLGVVASDIRHADFAQALKNLDKYPAAPLNYATQGSRLKDVYLKKMSGTPLEERIVDLVTKAGGRMASTKHAIDYDTSQLGSFFKAFQRGKLRTQMMAAGEDIKGAPIMGTARQIATGLARTMDTLNQPLFEHYIPAIKNAAVYENVAQWLRQNPVATEAEALAATRKFVDSVDNRFGEMIQDNIFWNKTFKQSAQLALLSYSWNMGGIREVGGGLRDISQVGKKPWTHKADYVVAMTLNWAIMSAIYQTLKTGETPQDLQDLIAPRTGGVDQRSGEPTRMLMPGIMKDVFAYREHGPGEIFNKLSPMIKTGGSVLLNKDYRGLPIVPPRDEEESTLQYTPRLLGNYLKFIIEDMAPIGVGQALKGPETGSNISYPELLTGFRQAPRQLIDPEGHEAMKHRLEYQKWFGKRGRGGKLQADERERQRYQGPE